MLKYCVKQWDRNKHKLLEDIQQNFGQYLSGDYKFLVEKVVSIIYNGEDDYNIDTYNAAEITEIDNGDYQGTLLYMIPRDTYQPADYEYLLTSVSYGSCSGCDTLQALQYDFEDDKEQQIKDFMQLCLHLVQNTVKPFNAGWADDDKYAEIIEE